jgi:hypothetical protein
VQLTFAVDLFLQREIESKVVMFLKEKLTELKRKMELPIAILTKKIENNPDPR